MALDSSAEPSTLSCALTVPLDERNIDDPARLADEAREIVQKAATELRAQRIPIDTEPPTIFKAD